MGWNGAWLLSPEPDLSIYIIVGSSFPTDGGVTASTEVFEAERHAGVHTPVIACKNTIANQNMAYAA